MGFSYIVFDIDITMEYFIISISEVKVLDVIDMCFRISYTIFLHVSKVDTLISCIIL